MPLAADLASTAVSATTSAAAACPPMGGSCEDGPRSAVLECSVCIEEVAVGERVVRLPCQHMYHSDVRTMGGRWEGGGGCVCFAM